MTILFVTNTVRKYALVYKNVISLLKEKGFDIVWAGNFSLLDKNEVIPCVLENIPIRSNPLHKSNLVALERLKTIIDKYSVDCIYCSTPIGSTLARLAAKHKQQIKVIYAAHGFLFFNHSNKWYLNPLFKMHEKYLAHYTDCLITITKEDYQYATNHLKLRKHGNVYLVNGAGIALSERPNIDRLSKRKALGLNENDYVIISAGFLNKNKNNITVIKALNSLKEKKIKYIICGEGQELPKLERYVWKHDLSSNVFFLGFRNDMDELYAISDVFIMPSFREGVPRSMLEAMNIGLPCIGSRVRGITDLIGLDEKGGCLCNPSSPIDFANAIRKTMEVPGYCYKERNMREAKLYSNKIVVAQLKSIIEKELC